MKCIPIARPAPPSAVNCCLPLCARIFLLFSEMLNILLSAFSFCSASRRPATQCKELAARQTQKTEIE